MNSPQQSQRPQSLLTMLPPQVQKQVLLLIKRLGDEKQAKQQFQKKFIIQEQEIEQLKKQIEKLKKQNLSLKSKWQSSFSMISKVRQNFSGSKKNLQEGQVNNKKKLRFNKQQNQWCEQQQQESQKQYKETINKEMKPTIKISEQYKIRQQSEKFFSISQTGIPMQTMPMGQMMSRSLQKSSGLETLPMMTAKKPPRQQTLQPSSSRSKLSSKSSKKQQIQSLKQEIQTLTQQIKSKQMGNMSLADKMRRCEEIKSRYKKGNNNSNINMNVNVRDNNDERIDESRFTNLNNSNVNINNNNNNNNTNNNNESFMISSGYHSPRSNNQQGDTFSNSIINQHLYTAQTNNNNKRSQQQSIQQQEKQSWKQNVMVNDSRTSFDHNNNKKSNVTINMNNPNYTQSTLYQQQYTQQSQQQQSQQQNIKSNNSFLNNTSAIYPTQSKVTIKQPGNQSFYDDGLLDLIQQMNP